MTHKDRRESPQVCALECLCSGRCGCLNAQHHALAGRISLGMSERNLACKLHMLAKQWELQEQTLSKKLLWPQVAETLFELKMTYFGKKTIRWFLKGYYLYVTLSTKPSIVVKGGFWTNLISYNLQKCLHHKTSATQHFYEILWCRNDFQPIWTK